MTQDRKENPAPHGRGTGEPARSQTPNSGPRGGKWKASFYWLHIRADGVEVRFDHPPEGILCLYVRIINEYYERTWTKLVPESIVDSGLWLRVEPRGEGWKYEYDDIDSTAWFRRVRS
jgi:hypothetical protein